MRARPAPCSCFGPSAAADVIAASTGRTLLRVAPDAPTAAPPHRLRRCLARLQAAAQFAVSRGCASGAKAIACVPQLCNSALEESLDREAA